MKTMFAWLRSYRVPLALWVICGLPLGAVADDHDSHDGGTSSGGSSEVIAEHQGLTYQGPGTCLRCHADEAHEVFGSSHYQWQGPDPFMLNLPNANRSKLSLINPSIAGGVNSYCGNIVGNWGGCSSCHIGRGTEPSATESTAQLENIDCLLCHQKAYKRKKDATTGLMVPDTANMAISMDQAVQTVHQPERANCLQCHAKAGGGDAVKRGDLALATANTLDEHYDQHMATTGANLQCQDCHVSQNHKIAGKGSDLRTTDLNTDISCGNSGCHSSKPHDASSLNRHTTKVACQTCHIPYYAKNAVDTAATEATETHRTWQVPEWNAANNRFDPTPTLANNLVPQYQFWDRYSTAYLLGDEAVKDPVTGNYPTSRPRGGVNDPASKLFPFKYKTSDYPLHTSPVDGKKRLVALNTSVYFKGGVNGTPNGDPTNAPYDAVASGLSNMAAMGILPGSPSMSEVSWVTTDTYQLLNHQVGTEDDAVQCTQCHLSKVRMDLQGQLGYAASKTNTTCSSGCHSASKARSWIRGSYSAFTKYHDKHVRGKGYGCVKCHSFSR